MLVHLNGRVGGQTTAGKFIRYRGGYLSAEIDGEWYFGKRLDWGDDDDHS